MNRRGFFKSCLQSVCLAAGLFYAPGALRKEPSETTYVAFDPCQLLADELGISRRRAKDIMFHAAYSRPMENE